MDIKNIRALNTIISRFGLANVIYGNKRDMNKALGYPETPAITVAMYRDRYERNEVAGRVVDALPMETWAGGGTIIEDDDPKVNTTFERAWMNLDKKFQLWAACMKADIVAGIGRHGVLLIGAPGELETELTACTPETLMYVMPYGEDDCKVQLLDTDPMSPRYGLPVYYILTRVFTSAAGLPNPASQKRVHFSRIIHIADNVLDDRVYGEPRLRRIWNRLIDLEKVAGGGAEAFWRRADGGRQFDLDPDVELSAGEMEAMKEQIDAYIHDQRRELTTRGLKINNLGSDVAHFNQNVDSIIGLISAGTGIPQRILMGSERGHLASTQDRSNWEARVESRRTRFAEPYILRPLVDKFIALGVLPEPEVEYRVEWENLQVQSDSEKADLALKFTTMNQQNSGTGGPLAQVDEIRTKVLGWEPIDVTLQQPTEQIPVALRALEESLVAKLSELV